MTEMLGEGWEDMMGEYDDMEFGGDNWVDLPYECSNLLTVGAEEEEVQAGGGAS